MVNSYYFLQSIDKNKSTAKYGFKKPEARAQIMLTVRKVLQKKGVSVELKEIMDEIMERAEARYKEWGERREWLKKLLLLSIDIST